MDSPFERAIPIRQGRLFKSFLLDGGMFINDIRELAKTHQAIVFILENITNPEGDILYIN